MGRKESICHPPKKSKGRGLCGVCYHKILIKENPEFHEKQKDNCKNWYKNNKEHVLNYQKEVNKKLSKDIKRDYRYRNVYGITLFDYNQMVEQQENKCFLCHKPPKINR